MKFFLLAGKHSQEITDKYARDFDIDVDLHIKKGSVEIAPGVRAALLYDGQIELPGEAFGELVHGCVIAVSQ